MPTEPSTPTISELVRRAAEVCDPDGVEEGVAHLLARFEDRDETVTSFGDVEEEIAEATGAVDPQQEDPAVTMAAAVVVYLAHRRTEIDDPPERLLQLATRAELDGTPPPPVAEWLAARGVSA